MRGETRIVEMIVRVEEVHERRWLSAKARIIARTLARPCRRVGEIWRSRWSAEKISGSMLAISAASGAVVEFAEQSHEPLHQRGIRIHLEMAAPIFDAAHQPHAGGAAGDAIGIRALVLGQARPLLAARDDGGKALVRVFDELEARDELLLFFREGGMGRARTSNIQHANIQHPIFSSGGGCYAGHPLQTFAP